MTFKSTEKKCVCSRTCDHEHNTMERYCLHEKNDRGDVISEMFMHGYDGEDDHIVKFIEESDEETGHRTNYFILNVSNV